MNPANPTGAPPKDVDYGTLINGIRSGDQTAFRELAQLFSPGIRFLLSRQIPEVDVESRLENVLSLVVQEIETKAFVPGQLAKFVLATLKSQRANSNQQKQSQKPIQHDRAKHERKVSDRLDILEQTKGIAAEVFRTMSQTELDVLRRYYVKGETPESILSTLSLSPADLHVIITKIKKPLREFNRRGRRHDS